MTRYQQPYHRDTYANAIKPAVGDLIMDAAKPSQVAVVVKTNVHGYGHMAEVEWVAGDYYGRGTVSVGLYIKVEDNHV